MLIVSAILFLELALLLAVPVLIGLYVYRDAKRRRMNAALWTLVAVLAPVFIGLIIYLIARANYTDLACPSCSAPVWEQYTVCPQCGAKLRPRCPACGTAVETGWQVCPSCAGTLPPPDGSVTPPVRHKDTALGKILVTVVILLVVFIGSILFFSFTTYSQNAGSMHIGSRTIEEFSGNSTVSQWITACDPAFDGLYVLSYQGTAQEQKRTVYLVYEPATQLNYNIRSTAEDSVFGHTLLLYLDTDTAQTDEAYPLTVVAYQADTYMDLQVFVDDVKRDLQITPVDFDPTAIG